MNQNNTTRTKSSTIVISNNEEACEGNKRRGETTTGQEAPQRRCREQGGLGLTCRRGRKQNTGIVMMGCVVVLAIAEERKKYIRGELASNATRCSTEGVGGTEELAVAKSRVDQTRTNTWSRKSATPSSGYIYPANSSIIIISVRLKTFDGWRHWQWRCSLLLSMFVDVAAIGSMFKVQQYQIIKIITDVIIADGGYNTQRQGYIDKISHQPSTLQGSRHTTMRKHQATEPMATSGTDHRKQCRSNWSPEAYLFWLGATAEKVFPDEKQCWVQSADAETGTPLTIMPHPITKCATDNIGEGCGRTYPKKTKAGLCVACEIIDKAEGEERVRKEVSNGS